MLYNLEQGKSEATIIQSSYREGVPLPKKIQEAPTLLPGLDIYFEAFYDLGSERINGMSVGEIPWRAAWFYARERLGMDEEEASRFWFLVKQMDIVYINHIENKNKPKNKKPIGAKGRK